MNKLKQVKQAIIITTISQCATEGLVRFSKVKDFQLILVGDKKSPAIYDINAEYLDVGRQDVLFEDFSRSLPFNHYTRKNLGYAFAIKEGFSLIAESDDDNIPYDHWDQTFQLKEYDKVIISPEMPNIYSLFTKEKIWPRGFPLDLINAKQDILTKTKKLKIGVWQGLANKEADVDAIYRLVIGKEIMFDKDKRFVLDQGVISAFNSQNTFWEEDAFPFLYLPSTVSFRYTDILRSFVAQFGLWARDLHLGFISPTCYQDRNPHNLLKDFKDEVVMHLETTNVIETLKSCSSTLSGSDDDLLIMYEALYKSGIVKKEELNIVAQWLKLVKKGKQKNI